METNEINLNTRVQDAFINSDGISGMSIEQEIAKLNTPAIKDFVGKKDFATYLEIINEGSPLTLGQLLRIPKSVIANIPQVKILERESEKLGYAFVYRIPQLKDSLNFLCSPEMNKTAVILELIQITKTIIEQSEQETIEEAHSRTRKKGCLFALFK